MLLFLSCSVAPCDPPGNANLPIGCQRCLWVGLSRDRAAEAAQQLTHDSSQFGTGPSDSKPPRQNERLPALRFTNSFRMRTSIVTDRKPRIMNTYKKRAGGGGSIIVTYGSALHLKPVDEKLRNSRRMNTYTKSAANPCRMNTCKMSGCKPPRMNTYKKDGGGWSIMVTFGCGLLATGAGSSTDAVDGVQSRATTESRPREERSFGNGGAKFWAAVRIGPGATGIRDLPMPEIGVLIIPATISPCLRLLCRGRT